MIILKMKKQHYLMTSFNDFYNNITKYGPLINTIITNSDIANLLLQMTPTKYPLKFNCILQ